MLYTAAMVCLGVDGQILAVDELPLFFTHPDAPLPVATAVISGEEPERWSIIAELTKYNQANRYAYRGWQKDEKYALVFFEVRLT